MITKKNITGIILSGGKSSRMGTNKGLLLYNEKPFTQYSIDALAPFTSEIIIVSNYKNYDVFGLKRVNDLFEEAGPLAGIYSGLKHSRTDYNLVLSCDIPLITSGIINQLVENFDSNFDVIQVESNHKTMPLIAMYKTSCKELFFKLLKQGERRLQYAVNQCKVKTITLDTENEKFTLNVNTPETLKTITNKTFRENI